VPGAWVAPWYSPLLLPAEPQAAHEEGKEGSSRPGICLSVSGWALQQGYSSGPEFPDHVWFIRTISTEPIIPSYKGGRWQEWVGRYCLQEKLTLIEIHAP